MTGRRSPATGRDPTNGPSPDAIRRALAVEIMDQDIMAELREKRKKHRKRAEGDGVNLAELDALYKIKDQSESEIEAWFRLKWTHVTSFFTGLGEQLDLFAVKSPREKRAAFFHLGMMAGLKGLPAMPPPNLVGDELTEWLAGHGQGCTSRDEAKDVLADTLADALATADAGGVVDGTGKGKGKGKGKAAPKGEAAKVAAKAAADFKADNPDAKLPGEEGFVEATAEELAAQKGRRQEPDETDPLVVGGIRYPNITRANAARQVRDNAAAKLAQAEAAKQPDTAA